MNEYDYINHVLANYFSANLGQTEEESISALQKHLECSLEFTHRLRCELQQALNDMNFSWKDSLAEHDVLFSDNENDAREYAKKLLLDSLPDEANGPG